MRLGLGIGLNRLRRGSGGSPPPGANLITGATGPTNDRVFQRAADTGGAFNLGTASVPFTLTFSADVSRLDYRVLNQADLAPITGWTQVGTTYSTGATVVNVTIPARLGWMRVEFRTEFSATTVVVADRFGVGRVMFMAGQSLGVRMFGKVVDTTTLAALSITPNPNGITYATYEDTSRNSLTPAWVVPADGTSIDSAGAATILNDQISAFGVQCALVGHTEGASQISAFLSGGAAYTQMTDIMTAVGGWEEFIWFQGHSDSNATQPLVYQQRLTTLFADVTSRNSRGTSYGRRLTSIPAITGGFGDANSISAIRQAQTDWAAANSATQIDTPDVGLVADGVHQTQAGAVALGRGLSRAMRGLMHPVIASATRVNGTDIDLTVTLPSGATSLSSVGSPGTRFDVFLPNNYGTTLALDGVTPVSISGNVITLKLAASQANDIDLDVWWCRPYDPVINGAADMIYDNSSDGFSVGRPIVVQPRRILARAITPAASALDLTMTTPTYSTSITNFGDRLSGGRGLTPGTNTGWPNSGTFTIEAWVTTTATAIQVALGSGTKGWMGINANGRICATFSNLGYIGTSQPGVPGTNPIINDGLPHHIAMVVSPAQARLYVDGVQAASVNSPGISAPATSLGVRYAPFGSFDWTGTIDEVAVWITERYTVNFTPPTSPYAGTESGLFQLWHLDGNGTTGVI